MDSDRDGRVDSSDIMEELRRAGTSAMMQTHGKAAMRAAQELGEQWRASVARGGVGLPEFLEALGGAEERIICARERFVAGEVAEVAYCLPTDIPSVLDASHSSSVRASSSSPTRLQQLTQRAGSPQPALPLPFLALVPAHVNSRSTLANEGAATVVQPIDPLQRSGTLHIRIPLAALGHNEWRLFDATSEAQGRQLGTGVPCVVEHPPAPFTPPPRGHAEAGEMVELRDPASTPNGSGALPSVLPPPRPFMNEESMEVAEVPMNSVDSSIWSDDIFVRLGGAPQLPPPVDLHARCVRSPDVESGTHVRLSWEYRSVSKDCNLSGFFLHWRALDACSESRCHPLGAHARDCVVGPLYSSSGYKFWMTAVGELGESSPSAKVEVRTGFWSNSYPPAQEAPTKVATKPGPLPSPVTIVAREADAVELSWSPPEDSGGLPLACYELQAVPHGGRPEQCVSAKASACRQRLEGLAVGLAHTLKLRAVGPLGPGPWSLQELPMLAALPKAPSQLRLLESAEGYVVLGWALPGKSARFRVAAVPAGGSRSEEFFDVPPEQLAAGRASFKLRLPPGVRHSFHVTAVGANGEVSPEATLSASAAPEPPLRPTNLRLLGAGKSDITLTWTPPAENGGCAVERYGVHLFSAGASPPEASPGALKDRCGEARLLQVCVTETASPRQVLEKLAPGLSYFAKVCAVSAAGAGDFSEVSEVFKLPSTGLPAAPLAPPLAAAVGVPTRTALSWEVPETAGVTQYIVLSRKVAEESHGEESQWEVQATTARTTHTVTGLSPSAAYEFAIRVVTAVGQSEPSPPSLPFHTGPRPPGAPGQPWLHGPSAAVPYDPLVAFAMPPEENLAPVRLFRCIAFQDNRPESTTEVPLRVLSVDDGIVMAEAHNLLGNCEYRLAVQAFNDGGWGPVGPSSLPAFVWRPMAPGRPVACPGAKSPLSLQWDAPLDHRGELILEYYIFVRAFPEDGPENSPAGEEVSRQLVCASPVAAGEETSPSSHGPRRSAPVCAAVEGLRRGRSYTFRVQAAIGQEPRPVSEESELLELRSGTPSAPGKPVVSLQGSGQSVRVEWSPSDSDGGYAIYGYRVHVHCLSKAATEMFGAEDLSGLPLQAPWVTSKVRGVAALQGGAQSKVLHATCNVGPGSPYIFEVQAINSQGASAPSLRSDVVHAPSAPPSAVRGLVARRSGPREADISWQPPSETGGLPVTHYLVTCTPREGDSGACNASVSAEGQNPHWVRHCMEQLLPGMEYSFCVWAVNAAGKGAEAEAAWTVLIPQEAEELG